MKRVQLAAVGWAGAGLAVALLIGLLAVEWWTTPLPASGWAAAAAYLLVSNVLLVRGLQRRRTERFGPANIVTSMRSTLVASAAIFRHSADGDNNRFRARATTSMTMMMTPPIDRSPCIAWGAAS